MGQVHIILALFLFLSAKLYCQSCLTSCPVNDSCSGTFPCGTQDPTVGAHGSDPSCAYSNPDPCAYTTNNGCSASQHFDGSCCYRVISPILIDLEGTGFKLSSAADGVRFRVFPDIPSKLQVAWPALGSENSWLVLDRNGNGKIDDFGELFGNETPQPDPVPGQEKNGFAALAVYDLPVNGGNNDGWITKDDSIYKQLQVWTDTNHDGVSQKNELHPVESVGITAISVRYTYSKRIDEYGNIFRFRSVIRDQAGSEVNKTIYDVFLQLGPTESKNATGQLMKSPDVAFLPIK